MKAWILDPKASSSGVDDIIADSIGDNDATVDVYSLSGVRLRSGVSRDEATAGLPAGFYIVGGRKVAVR